VAVAAERSWSHIRGHRSPYLFHETYVGGCRTLPLTVRANMIEEYSNLFQGALAGGCRTLTFTVKANMTEEYSNLS